MAQALITNEMRPKEPSAGLAINGRFLAGLVRQRPLLFTFVLLLPFALTAIVWFLLPIPTITSRMVFWVRASQPSIVAAPSDHNFANFKQAQLATLKKRSLLSRVLAAPEVAELPMITNQGTDALRWLEKAITTDFKVGTEFMRVSIEGDVKDELLTLMKALSKTYLDTVEDAENGSRRALKDSLERIQNDYKSMLTRNYTLMDNIAKVLGSSDTMSMVMKQQFIRDEYSSARAELLHIRNTLALAEGVDTRLEKTEVKEPTVPEEAIEEAIEAMPDARKARETMTKLETEISRMELNASDPNNPIIRRKRDALDKAKIEWERYVQEAKGKLIEKYKDIRVRADKSRRENAKVRVVELKESEKELNDRVQDLMTEMSKQGQYRLDLEKHKRDIASVEKMMDKVSDKLEHIRIELGAPSRVVLNEEPYIIEGIEGNKRLKMSLITAVASFFLGFGGLIFWEIRHRRIGHVADVSEGLGLKLVGAVPSLVITDRNASTRAYQEEALAEAIDTTRAMLLYGNHGKPIRSVLITSAVSGEGKTSLASHLAVSLTRGGYRTLLIDGDLRSPSAHRVFGLTPAPGFSELLRGEVEAADVIQTCPLPNLAILPAGQWSIAASQSLTGARWAAIKAELENEYDFIIFDSAPVLPVVDSLLMARSVCGVVLTVRQDFSRVHAVQETMERLSSVGANVLGVVISGVDSKAFYPQYRSQVHRRTLSLVQSSS